MKKFVLSILLAACSFLQLFALRPGDRAPEPLGIKMLQGGNIDLSPADKSGTLPPLRAVVFLLCRAVNAETTVSMLDDLQRAHRGELRIGIITPDAIPDAEALLQTVGKTGIAFGVDSERKLTRQYMAGSLLYPMAFLIDRQGVILWCGEAVDLAEKIRPALDGKLSVADEAKIAELVAELQQLLRDNSETKMKRIANRIFDIEPGNAAAMRLRLFTLENTNRIAAARELMDSQLKAAPRLTRLYFTAADFAARHDYSDAELERIVSAFERHIADPEPRVRMGWMLLERFPYHPSALRAAARMLRVPLPAPPLPRANAAAGRALLEYRLGNLREALALQQEAVKQLNSTGSAEALDRAKKRENYFRTVLEMK